MGHRQMLASRQTWQRMQMAAPLTGIPRVPLSMLLSRHLRRSRWQLQQIPQLAVKLLHLPRSQHLPRLPLGRSWLLQCPRRWSWAVPATTLAIG